MRFPSIDRDEIKADPYPAFGRWIAKVEKSLGEWTLLLCLDEFEKLDEGFNDGRFDKRILSTIRNLIQHHNRIAVLLSGSHHIGELPPHWADTLVTTQMIPLSFLDEANARDLILHPVPDFPDDEENLWLACRLCNNAKRMQTHGYDPLTRRRVRLFNPRNRNGGATFNGAMTACKSSDAQPVGGQRSWR